MRKLHRQLRGEPFQSTADNPSTLNDGEKMVFRVVEDSYVVEGILIQDEHIPIAPLSDLAKLGITEHRRYHLRFRKGSQASQVSEDVPAFVVACCKTFADERTELRTVNCKASRVSRILAHMGSVLCLPLLSEGHAWR